MGNLNQFKVKSAVDSDLMGGPDGLSTLESTTKVLLRLLQRINVRDAGKRNKNDKTILKEIEMLHEEEFRNQ